MRKAEWEGERKCGGSAWAQACYKKCNRVVTDVTGRWVAAKWASEQGNLVCWLRWSQLGVSWESLWREEGRAGYLQGANKVLLRIRRGGRGFS